LENYDYLPWVAMITSLGKPALFVMEGGDMVEDIGVHVAYVLAGLEGENEVIGNASGRRQIPTITSVSYQVENVFAFQKPDGRCIANSSLLFLKNNLKLTKY
jgi:acetoin utilization deacetylase AcuC-like enzyme